MIQFYTNNWHTLCNRIGIRVFFCCFSLPQLNFLSRRKVKRDMCKAVWHIQRAIEAPIQRYVYRTTSNNQKLGCREIVWWAFVYTCLGVFFSFCCFFSPAKLYSNFSRVNKSQCNRSTACDNFTKCNKTTLPPIVLLQFMLCIFYLTSLIEIKCFLLCTKVQSKYFV